MTETQKGGNTPYTSIASGTRTRRICAGLYTVTCGVRAVTIEYRADLKGWVAAANWDQWLYTDPVPTKNAAVYNAQIMLKE